MSIAEQRRGGGRADQHEPTERNTEAQGSLTAKSLLWTFLKSMMFSALVFGVVLGMAEFVSSR